MSSLPPRTFESLGLSPPLLKAVAELGYTECTAVQAAAIPAILRGLDVWASAETGSGKTAAYVLPILETLRSHPRALPRIVRALVIVPTRELALQIGGVVRTCSSRLPEPPKTCVVIGGVSANLQQMELRGGADVVIATPGRLLDLLEKNALRISSVDTLVLDEADRLLSLGFADELQRVLAELPSRRQNLLFSATFPPSVRALADGLLRDPMRIAIDAGATGTEPREPRIAQRAIEVDASARTALLRHLIAAHAWVTALVFVASRHTAEHVARKLADAGVTAVPLHGELSQGARARALADFTAGRVQVLVATDVAARGLDIAHLPAVVNYDLPRSTTEYPHRIGRTGRAGESGVAVSFISAATDAHFRLISKRNRLDIPRERIPGFEPVELAVTSHDPNGGVKGKRKSKKDKLREAAAKAAAGGGRRE